jgi:cysteinyl-tRNA synthetase
MWVHHGFVTVRNEQTSEAEKMSKSLGNFLTIRDLSEIFHPEVLKLFVFSTQYRNPLEYSGQAMQDAMSGLTRLYECVHSFENLLINEAESSPALITEKEADTLSALEQRFQRAMDNDFNTAQAIGQLFEATRAINKIISKLPSRQNPADVSLLSKSVNTLTRLARIMGLLNEPPGVFLDRQKQEILKDAAIDEASIEQMIKQRNNARKDKDWALSDQIRDELLTHNIELKDGPKGTTWTVKRD